MNGLDLSKAVEAGARVLVGQILISDYDELSPQTRYAFKSDTESIVAAALPHILDALAEEADGEVKDAEDRLDALASAVAAGWVQRAPYLNRMEYSDYTARWLRAEAEEMRRG